MDGSTRWNWNKKMKGLASIWKTWKGRNGFIRVFDTDSSQRDVHLFSSWSYSGQKIKLCWIRCKLFVQGIEKVISVICLWRVLSVNCFNLFHLSSIDWLMLPYHILNTNLTQQKATFQTLWYLQVQFQYLL